VRKETRFARRVTEREFKKRLTRRAKVAHAPAVSPELCAALWTYFALLFRWNAKINLTSFSEDHPDEAIDRLLVEPLIAAQFLPSPGARVIDVGSGGGSPAIPLKLASPPAPMVMIESKARKSAFLREAARQLGLTNVEVATARVEELFTRADLHESSDVVTMRAVRVDVKVLNGLQAFLKPGGLLFLVRTSAVEPSSWVAPALRQCEVVPIGETARLVILEKVR
jgi:16S rRNA (guanine527-N7)-methyltransferase